MKAFGLSVDEVSGDDRAGVWCARTWQSEQLGRPFLQSGVHKQLIIATK